MNLILYLSRTLLVFAVCISCAGRNNVESQSATNSSIRKMPSANCENCELMFVGMPEKIYSSDTTEGWFEKGQKLIVTGKVFQQDQTTPASDITIYYYHTDQQGYYSPGDLKDNGSQKHGRLRGWVKSGTDGTYSIYTSRPAQYPGNKIEAHIHVLIKEPDIDVPYWIDEWIFDDDPLVTPALRQRLENRGGSGILKPILKGDVQVANHDIILGLNIPGYPTKD